MLRLTKLNRNTKLHITVDQNLFRRGLRTSYFKSGNNNNNWQGFYRRNFNPNRLHLSIIGANIAIFGLYKFSDAQWKRFNDPKWMRFMLKNFTASYYNLSNGRLWTLITSSFLHTRLDSLIFNMLTFYFLAPNVIAMIGARSFMALYCTGGIAATASTLSNPANGASGAVGSTIGYFAAAYPNATFSLYFLLPIQAWVAVGGLVAWDLYNTFNNPYVANVHKSRLSGTLSGVAFLFLRTRFRGPTIPWR